MEKKEKGLERTKLGEPWKMLKNFDISKEITKYYTIGDIQISEIKNSTSIQFDIRY